jgi:tRNA(Ile)-lysidine synthase TilS/MesJ
MTLSLTYGTWKDDNKTILETLPQKDIIITYTGGKDCSILLDFILQASKEFSFNFQTHAFLFPVHVFTPDEITKLDSYWNSKGVKIVWHKLKHTDDEFEIAKNNGINPCVVCFQRKREYFLEFLNKNFERWDSVVVIVGFTLWDLVSYSLEQLLFSVFHIDSLNASPMIGGKPLKDRFIQTSQRFYPFLAMKEGYSVYKPLLKYNDPEIIRNIQERKIPLSTNECKYKSYRPKRLFADCYRQMNLLFDYNKLLSFAKESLNLYDISYYNNFSKEEFISEVL